MTALMPRSLGEVRGSGQRVSPPSWPRTGRPSEVGVAGRTAAQARASATASASAAAAARAGSRCRSVGIHYPRRTITIALARGAAHATGAGLVGLLFWWITHR
ncbi:hypothetical protein ACFLIM_46900 [Nonomuraea sp. M3C6]|uniref:Uncharacterized protein n=1 Tax=Nonomuraea marmarensis TaxID=3351344 RepID=A0ABW7ATF8_9ACTN